MSYTDNIIPTMTSATAPSGTVSASSEYYAAWQAFDHLNGAGAANSWITDGVSTGWVQYQFPAANVVAQYAITSANSATNPHSPKTWTFKGSNNGTDWVTLDTQTNITDWAALPPVRKVFPFTNSTAYAYYRLDITASNDAGYGGVGELEMMEAAVVPGDLPASSGSISLAGSADLIGLFAVVDMDAGGSIALTGSAGLTGFFAVVDIAADGTIDLDGSASLTAVGLTYGAASGNIALTGYADLCQWEPMVAVGTIALCGEAWLTTVLHGEDTLQAVGAIELRVTAVRLSTGETLPPTDDLGWTLP